MIVIELIALRDVGCNTPYSGQLFSWLASVAKEACAVRHAVRVRIHLFRNLLISFYLCQPNHPGKLVQVGMNMGPRHARVLGWAKSYTKKLDVDTMIEYDLDAVGGLSIMWSFVQSVMPLEVRDHVNSRLAEVGLPRLATRNVDEGAVSIFNAVSI